ncbi:MAG: hypothetical protein E6Q97_21190 [Desulfurellales bacterium]|nr:MAG: hypothetical protein E6Q97_21190 [Desulfurellales bacterium]
MISAFGVEHGEISKGLPSALRQAGGPLRYGALKPNSTAAKYIQGRKGANAMGQRAARSYAISANQTNNPGLKMNTMIRGQNASQAGSDLKNKSRVALTNRERGWQ